MNDKDNIYFFYKGMPYKRTYLWENESMVSGKCEWDTDYIKVKISEIEYCTADKIEEIYNSKCKENIIEFLHGWTSEKAKELEKKGLEYLLSQIKYYLINCPRWIYNASKKGKYGVLIDMSSIKLPEDLKMNDRKCSDGLIRSNKEYLMFLLGDEWDQLKIFSEKWPLFKFSYKDELNIKSSGPFDDMYCMTSFYNDPSFEKETYNSLIL